MNVALHATSMAKGGFIDGGGLETRKKKYCVYVSRA
jgi:hypothetical protein